MFAQGGHFLIQIFLSDQKGREKNSRQIKRHCRPPTQQSATENQPRMRPNHPHKGRGFFMNLINRGIRPHHPSQDRDENPHRQRQQKRNAPSPLKDLLSSEKQKKEIPRSGSEKNSPRGTHRRPTALKSPPILRRILDGIRKRGGKFPANGKPLKESENRD